MKLPACAAAMALAFGAAHAWTFDASEVAPPEDIVGEHQPLQRSWTVSSFAQLEQLYLAIPGRVFVDLDPSLLPATEAPSTESPATEAPSTEAPSTEIPSTEAPVTEAPGVVPGETPGVVPGVIPGVVPGFVPGAVPAAGSLSGSGSEWNDTNLAGDTIEIPTMMLRKHHHKHEDDDEQQGEETVVAKIVVTGNSTDLLNMIEAAPLHPRRNDGLKLHLKNEDAYGEGYVLTQIYLFEKNLLRRVTTAFSGDVVLNENVVTLDDAEADVKLACVGDANLYLESSSNATLASLEVEVTGSGLAQLEIPSVNLESSLDVEVAGSGSVALVTDALAAGEVKTTLSGSGNIVVDTSDLEAQKLDASVYGSGISSFATAGAVDKETLTLSGPGQLLAGSIVARKSEVDVWGDGDMLVQVTDKLTVSTSVWGKVGYVNAPPTDVKIKGWWFWREASSIVYPAAVNKVLIYEPAAVPAKYPVYYSIETAESALSDDPAKGHRAVVYSELRRASSPAVEMVSNAFVLCKVRHNVSLAPCHAMEPRVGIEQDLTAQLMRYSQPLQGVVLSFSDVQLAQPHGVIVNEMPHIHCKVLADALVFRPKEGMQLRGVVNKIGSNHVGMLFAGVFNGSVAEAELPKGYVHNYAQDCWLGEDGSSISVEDEVDVKVLRVHVAGGMIAIEATMRFEGAGVKKATVKKAKKATHLDLSAAEPETETVEVVEVEAPKEKKQKKEKKSKKTKHLDLAASEPVVAEPVKEEAVEKGKVKKSKKTKHLDLSAAEPEVVEPVKEVAVEQVKEKKVKKSKKRKLAEDEVVAEEPAPSVEEPEVKPKKHKHKDKDAKKKKSKKSKQD